MARNWTTQDRAAFAQRMADARRRRQTGSDGGQLVLRPQVRTLTNPPMEYIDVMPETPRSQQYALPPARRRRGPNKPKTRIQRYKGEVKKQARKVGRGYDKLGKKRPWVIKVVRAAGTILAVGIVGEAIAAVADTLVPEPVVGAVFALAGIIALGVRRPTVGLTLLGIAVGQLSYTFRTYAQALKERRTNLDVTPTQEA